MPGSVTMWIRQLQEGEQAALQELWQRYLQRVVALARPKLRNSPRAVADEEDDAISAFESFHRGALQGRFPRLRDRNDLWQVLMLITARNAINLAKHEARQKRGGGTVVPLSSSGVEDEEGPFFVELISKEPDPGFVAELLEQFQLRLAMLPKKELQEVARLKMQGHTNREIAQLQGCVSGTVERRLRLICQLWKSWEQDS